MAQLSFAQSRGCVATDMAEVVSSGNAGIRAGHTILPSWSAEAGASFHIGRTYPGKDGLAQKAATSMELSFRHWPHGCYKGMYISTGVLCRFRKDTDLTVGAGYCQPLWKGIALDIGYSLKVIDTIRRYDSGYKGLRIEICYIF